MVFGELTEVLAMALVFVVHVIGGGLLVWALLDEDSRTGWRRRWGRGGDDGPRDPPLQPRPPVRVRRAPLPLPESEAGRVRLREPARAGDDYPRPARRPQHPPEPVPGRPARHS